MLCPIEAVTRRLIEAGGFKTSLFGYYKDGVRHHLTKAVVVSKIQSVLRRGGFDGYLGHSFRVGGASLRFAFKKRIEDICDVGRWKSSCYKLYIRDYSMEDLEEARKILRELKIVWKGQK
ncbi:hypothetical protein PTTG_27374 [Puccinia triticina 1-1 BBBD Race 1]|uniref:Tyr recombinase domain-containing protein n=1 Tax=Puccinia triticina (isolate 1-1 / race 1 (BBBD)) TaxID=630390 RepID=A0A180GLJ1_PUCT1|nr:hypothetical protein PTTG_27374 [Puccinia triticina 1-1 BBBD Race 1]